MSLRTQDAPTGADVVLRDGGSRRGSWWWLWRSAVAPRWAPVVVILGVALTLANAAFLDTYWLAATSIATVSLLVLAPAVAGIAAWEAGRLRSWQPRRDTAVRQPIALLIATLLPLLVLTVLTFGVTLAVLAPRVMGAPGGPDPALLAVSSLVAITHAAVGYGAGLAGPRVFAVPGAVAASFVWLAYPVSFEPTWIRHLTGAVGDSCCDVDATVAPAALWAPTLMSIGVLVVVVLLISVTGRHRRQAVAAGVGVLLVTAAGAHALVLDLGPFPVQPRSGQVVCSTGAITEICVWPEHRPRVAAARPVIEDTLRRLRSVGIEPPRRVSEAPESPGVWNLMIPDPTAFSGIRPSLARHVLGRGIPDCANTAPWPGAAVLTLLSAWLDVTAGVPSADVANAQSPAERVRLAEVRALSEPRQLAWFRANLRAVRTCDVQPVAP